MEKSSAAPASRAAFMQKSENKLAQRFDLQSLLRFAMPSIGTMVFLSLYTIVDGIFLARTTGTLALSALNMSWPCMSLMFGLCAMISAGGSAVVVKKMGEGKIIEAQRNFSALTGIMLLMGAGISLGGLLWLDKIVALTGSSGLQAPHCRDYLQMLFSFAPAFCLQFLFQAFFIAAGKPGWGLGVTLAAGITNMVMDYVLMVPLHMGICGAGLATGLGCAVTAVVGLTYFTFQRKGTLYLRRPTLKLGEFLHVCTNGSSEMVSNMALVVTGYLFNISFLHYMGEDGVAALAVVFYFEFLFSAAFAGYANGVAPVISYKFGAEDRPQLRAVVRKSIGSIGAAALLLYLIPVAVITYIMPLFLPDGGNVRTLATHGFYLYAPAFLFMGFNIFASTQFTALSNGLVSAVISFARTFLFLTTCILLLPLLIGPDGLWLAVPVSELLSTVLAAIFLISLRKRYGY